MTRYAILPTPAADDPIWGEVGVTPDTARPSIDGSMRILSWEGPGVPASLPEGAVVYGRGGDDLPNIFEALDGPEWTPTEVEP